jgi:hypothetical protein
MESLDFINKNKKNIKCWPSEFTYDRLIEEVKIKKFILSKDK